MKRNIFHFICSLSVVMCCILAISFSSCKGSGPSSTEGDDTTKILEADTIIDLKVDTLILNEDTEKYNFNVSCAMKSGKNFDILYVLTVKGEGDKKVSENHDGKFQGIEGLEDEGVYIVTASVPGAENIQPASVEVPGCVKIVKNPPLEKEWLQAKINALGSDASSELYKTEMIVPDYKLVYKNLDSDESKPEGFASIAEKLMFGDWQGITVDEVEYDKFNRVTSITMTISH